MRIICVISLFILSACSTTCPPSTILNPSGLLSKSGSIHMMLAKDGTDGKRTYYGSGRALSKLLYQRMLTVADRAKLAAHVESRDEAVASARAHGINYLFEPVILKWRNPAAKEKAGDDYISVRIGVWDVATGKELASGTFSTCKSGQPAGTLALLPNGVPGPHPMGLGVPRR